MHLWQLYSLWRYFFIPVWMAMSKCTWPINMVVLICVGELFMMKVWNAFSLVEVALCCQSSYLICIFFFNLLCILALLDLLVILACTILKFPLQFWIKHEKTNNASVCSIKSTPLVCKESFYCKIWQAVLASGWPQASPRCHSLRLISMHVSY